jgi:two-component system OmpR family sensor kinase
VPLRWRLAVWYALLTAVTLLVTSLLSYAYHARNHYDDLDRVLVQNAAHASEEVQHWAGGPLLGSSGDLLVILRLYDPSGRAIAGSPEAGDAPPVRPHLVLAEPSTHAYGSLIAFLPSFGVLPAVPEGAAFAVVPGKGQRWRVFAQGIEGGRFVAALTPLGRLDASLAGFRTLLVIVNLTAIAAMLLVGVIVAGGALGPVVRVTSAAESISRSRDLSRRVPAPSHRDEPGRLAATFNRMLASLEEASHAQQRFVADASHELRAPLTAIQGNLALLRRRPDMPPEYREETLAEAERESARLARLVADLLALARADAGVGLELRSVDLDAVALDAFRSAQALARGQKLSVDALTPAQVPGDEDRLKQLLIILLDNAIRYTPPEGKVSLSLTEEDGFAVLVVQDEGVGIPAADLPHVFERFYRADPARGRDPGGTGLGLAIAQWIVEQHHGQVTVDSQVGAGTRVTVRLPLKADPPSVST